jgi:2-polyprenyl-3-methyl-5-hydroxy-6-metoxy-1,4-benzoquinol methylase
MSLRTRSLYPFVLAAMCDRPREEREGLRVLDVPSGDGVLSFALAAAGYRTTAADLFPEYFEDGRRRATSMGAPTAASLFEAQAKCSIPGWLADEAFRGRGTPAELSVTCAYADMESEGETAGPGEGGGFDAVVCVEGIEHVIDRHRTLTNFRRRLRTGGRLLITTPNLLSLRARLAYLLAGQRAFKSSIDEYTSVWGISPDRARIYHGHAFLLTYFQLRYSLHHCGFRIKRLWASNWSPSSLVLTPLVPLIWAATRISERPAHKKFAQRVDAGWMPRGTAAPFDAIRSDVLSASMLLNATLIVDAEAVDRVGL